LRYTPAGTPIIELTVNHVSQQIEADIARQITCEIFAVAVGRLALSIAEFKINCAVKLSGFLNRRSHMNQQLILHIDHIKLI
jgi:primosomal replication protein N